MARKLKNVENETQTLFKLNWQDTLKNGENEKYTLQNLDYGKNTEKTWKMRHKHCLTWYVVRNKEKQDK